MDFYSEYTPGFEYYFEHSIPPHHFDWGSGLAVAAAGVLLAVLLMVLAFAVLTYVLRSIGLYTMAKKRGIPNAWLAWVPVGSSWIMGAIADDANARQGKKTVYGMVLLILTAVTAAGSISLFLLPLLGLFSAPVSLAVTVVYYIALYEIYQDYAPKNAVLFLVLSILLSVPWLLLFLLRDRLPAVVNGVPHPPTAAASAEPADSGWQPVQPRPAAEQTAQSPVGWCPDPAWQMQLPQQPKECPPEHWGGIMTVEQPGPTLENENNGQPEKEIENDEQDPA